MASMLEALREYRHLATRKRAEGQLPAPLEARLRELSAFVEESRASSTSGPRSSSGARPVRASGVRGVPSTDDLAALSSDVLPAVSRTSSHELEVASADSNVRGGPAASRELELDPVMAWVERVVPRSRRLIVGSVFVGLLGLSVALPLGLGLSRSALTGLVLPQLFLAVGGAWGLVYPAALAWWEYAGRRGTAHINEPDFRARLPFFEPLIASLALLVCTAWLLGSGLAADGVGPAIGAVSCFVFGLAAFGIGAAALARPFLGRLTRARAYYQYVEGSSASLKKSNPRRARRLLERALAIAEAPERRADLEERLEQAILAEAEQLRHRGREEQANALVESIDTRRSRKKVPDATRRPPPVENRGSSLPVPGRASATDVVPMRRSQAMVLPMEGVEIEEGPPPREPQRRTLYDRAMTQAARGRAREALEILVQGGLSVPPELAREAAEQYKAQGVLRSAFVLYELLGEPQIPEMYKAVAVEWARAVERRTDRLPLGARILDALERNGEAQTLARVAYQVALEEAAEPELRVAMAMRAERALRGLGASLPADLLEVTGRYEEAAVAYEAAGQAEDVRRCLSARADELVSAGARPATAVPILSKLFRYDPAMKDQHLSMLVDHVLDTNASGAGAQKVLVTWRSRHPDDQRVAFRLFHLLVAAERPDEALSELTRIARGPASEPRSLVDDFRRLVGAFPRHTGAREALVRALARAGRVQEAARELEFVAGSLEGAGRARLESLRSTVASFREWGLDDPMVDLCAARIEEALGNKDAALSALEAHVHKGGADAQAMDRVIEGLSSRLANSDGSPNHDAHVGLVQLLFRAHRFEEALPLLDVLKVSTRFGSEARLLRARILLERGAGREAVRALVTEIEGRKPAEVPEAYFELAEGYERVGDATRASKIRQALDRIDPAFRARYAGSRPGLLSAEEAPGDMDLDTDVGASLEEGTLDDVSQAAQVASALASDGGEPLQPTIDEEPDDLGAALAPRYRLIRKLGAGGMGEVHLAEDLSLGREVAVKVLRRNLATDLFIAKLRDEARIVAQLSHPGIVGVFDIGQKSAWSYIVMEYVRGPNLATLVSSTVPPPSSRIIEYIAAVADAMAYAHRRGVVHRDLKPANILVGIDGSVKVTDFGIARVLAGEPGEETAFSAAGLQVNTVSFMAPEQLTHDHADARTDIYLLATTLYYCMCRRYPFHGKAAQARKLDSEAPRVQSYNPRVSDELDALLAAALARRPEHRPPNMYDFAEALREVPEASGERDATVICQDPSLGS